MATARHDLTTFLKAQARRLLDLQRDFKTLASMASPPTIAVSAASAGSTIGSVVNIDANDYSKIRIIGTDPINAGSAPLGKYLISPGHMRFNSGSGTAFKNGYYGGNFYRMAFMTDAPVVEVDLFHLPNGSFRVFVDGVPTALAATASSGDYSVRKTKLTFGSSTPRLIEFELGRMNGGQIGIGPNYSVWLPDIDPLRVLAVSDSFFDNGADYGASYVESLGPSFLRALNVPDSFLDAIGGLGYINIPGAYEVGSSARTHIADEITPYAPSWIIVALGINDQSYADADLFAAVSAYFKDLMEQNPNAIVTVIGPWRSPGLNPAQSKADAIKNGVATQQAAVDRRQLRYVDTYADNWQQIAGRVGATSGAGNSNIYIGADSVHPVAAGQDYLRSRLLRACRHHLELLAAAA